MVSIALEVSAVEFTSPKSQLRDKMVPYLLDETSLKVNGLIKQVPVILKLVFSNGYTFTRVVAESLQPAEEDTTSFTV